VGLDNLNALCERCVSGELSGALELLGTILENGTASEQFIIDMASYFRSLLFLAAGITRESVLGYKAERFSAKVRESLTPQRLEHGLEIMLELYRDIRYSVSPRFELEAAVTKLSALKTYVGPEELALAIEELRSVVGSRAAAQPAAPTPLRPAWAREPDAPKPMPQAGARTDTDEVRQTFEGTVVNGAS
jgi:DNA polymerase-3 subunit gamma/tau